MLESLVLARLSHGVILIGVVWHCDYLVVGQQRLVNWLVLALSVVAELAVSKVMDGLMGHGLLESNWGAVVRSNNWVHDSLVMKWHFMVHKSLVNDWDGFVMNDGLVVDNGHNMADNLVVDRLVVRDSLVDDWGVMVHWLVGSVVVDGLLMEGLLTVVVGVGALVVFHLMVSVRSLVMSVVWLVVHLVGAESAMLGVAISVMLIAIVNSVVSFDSVMAIGVFAMDSAMVPI